MRLWGWWRYDCGHRCCPLRHNRWHEHPRYPHPERCPFCDEAAAKELLA